MSNSSASRILHRLNFHSSKFHHGIALEDEVGERVPFCEWFLESIKTRLTFREDIIFSEEVAVFHLHGGVNHKN